MIGRVSAGLCVLIGVGRNDQETHAEDMAKKIINLRVFEDAQGKMNLSVLDVKGAILAVSQFTLYGDCSRGHRPSFSQAAAPERAEALYSHFVNCLKTSGLEVCTGRFGAKMEVALTNDGPVTLTIEI